MERVVLVGIAKKGANLRPEEDLYDRAGLAELQRLTETAGGTVVDVLLQRLQRPHPGSLIGKGKVEEVRLAVQTHDAVTVIFDENLTPAQQIYLEKEIKAKIVDRTRLILDIFAQRARTKEGELQVELAVLSYMLPRLTGSWRAFSQQAGGIGTRGPGERKLEYERRHIQRRIARLKTDISQMAGNRKTQRRRRNLIPVPSVAIIGYTNAGKSSLLNHLTNQTAKVYADDKLFATLDPTTRRVRLPEGGWAVFTDTVGFISKLPTSLIDAFRSTLEEVARADCILQLEDGESPIIARQREVVDEVLRTLEAEGIPRVFAVNKSDTLPQDQRIQLRARDSKRLLVSARTGENISSLLQEIQQALNARWLLRDIEIEPEHARLLQEVYNSAQVLSQRCRHGRIILQVRVTRENWSRLIQKLGRVAPGK